MPLSADNIDTRTALMAIRDLVVQTNAYITKISADQSAASNRGLLKNVAQFITEIFNVLGLIPAAEQIGFTSAAAGETANVSNAY